MGIDLSKIKSRLEGLKNTSGKNKSLWKPKPGKFLVRIVPYKHQPDNPFVELYFHYGLNEKTFLSPMTFNRPDPIVELSNKLKKGSKEEWAEGRKLEPKMRVYVPVIVRGEEDEGVRYWGMGKQVYEEILAVIADPDYGDITDLRTGRDLVVEVKSKEETKKQWGSTSVRPKPNVSVAFDPSNVVLKEAIKNQVEIATLWPEPTYDELAHELDIWLNGPSSTEGGDGNVPADYDATAGDVPSIDDEQSESPASKSKSAPTSATLEAAAKPKQSAQSVADEFDSLFNG